MKYSYILLILLILLVVNVPKGHSGEFADYLNNKSERVNDWTLMTDTPSTGLVVDNLLASAAITAWGFEKWAWGTAPFHISSEGWFEADSKTGGSDKTGHFYMTYLLSRVLAARMEDRAWSKDKASLAGALSGLLAMTVLEIGDGTSPYGFSYEDFIADSLGALLAYGIRAYPAVDNFLDIRLEYWPTKSYRQSGDLTTDYSGMKHLVAFRLGGFERLKDSLWGLIELQTGYYSRGYRSYDTVEPSRNVYVGLGISLSELGRRSGVNVLSNIFEFYQPGGTYVEGVVWSGH